MKVIHNNIIFFLLLIPFFLLSQIKQEELIIKRKYEVNPKNIEKKQKNPSSEDIPKTIMKIDEKIDYTIIDVEATTQFEPTILNSEKPNVEILDETLNHYIKVGYGNYQKLLTEAFLTFPLQKSTKLGLEFNHISTSGLSKNTIPWSSNQSKNKLGGFIYHKFDESDMQFSLNFKTDKINNYGLSIDSLGSKNIDILNQYNQYSAKGYYDLFTNKYFDYASFEASYLSNKFDLNESKFNLNVKFTKADFISNFIVDDLKFGFLLDAGILTTYTKFNKFDSNINQLKLDTKPALTFNFQKSYLKIGANINYFSNKEIDFYSKVNIYPEIEFNFYGYPELEIFGKLEGNLNPNNLHSIVGENLYLYPYLTLKPSNTKYHIFGGLKGIINKKINYKISSGFEKTNDYIFFSKNKFIDLQNLNEYNRLNTFDVVYDNISRFYLQANASIKPIDYLEFGSNLLIQSFTLDKLKSPYNKSPLEINIYGSYKMLNNKLIFGLQTDFIGSRKSNDYDFKKLDLLGNYVLEEKITTLKPYLDLNLSALYKLNQHLSIFFNGNNLLNSKYEKFSNYKVLGFQILGGFSYTF